MNGRTARPRTYQKVVEKHPASQKPARDPATPELKLYRGNRCPACRGSWLSVDLDDGATPIFGPCFATKGCRGTAFAMGYCPGEPPKLPVLIEWYKPLTTKGLSFEMCVHAQQGGLVRRATVDAPEWVKRIA